MQQRIPTPLPRHLVAVSAPFRNPLAPIPPAPIRTLLPVIARHSDLTPALERLLRPVALRAKDGDWSARDALYAAFEPKLYRIARKIWVPAQSDSTVGTWDFEDVWQEAWIVFATLLDTWPPHIDVGRYLLAQFPWRLRDAVRKTLRRAVVPLACTIGMPVPKRLPTFVPTIRTRVPPCCACWPTTWHPSTPRSSTPPAGPRAADRHRPGSRHGRTHHSSPLADHSACPSRVAPICLTLLLPRPQKRPPRISWGSFP